MILFGAIYHRLLVKPHPASPRPLPADVVSTQRTNYKNHLTPTGWVGPSFGRFNILCMYSAAAVSTTPPNVRQSRSAVYSVLEHTRLQTLLLQSADSLGLSRCPITALLCNAFFLLNSSGPLVRNSNLGLVLIPYRASQFQYNLLWSVSYWSGWKKSQFVVCVEFPTSLMFDMPFGLSS